MDGRLGASCLSDVWCRLSLDASGKPFWHTGQTFLDLPRCVRTWRFRAAASSNFFEHSWHDSRYSAALGSADAQARILISPDAVGTVCQARVQALAFLCFLARSAPSSSDARCRFDVLSSLDDDESLLDITRLRRVCGAFPCEAGVRQTSTKGRRRASRHRRARPPTWPDRNKDRRSARASSADTISVMRSAPSLAFALTFLAYVALHAERKAYTNVKSAAVADWHMTPDALSVLDTTFMLTYAAGLYASGALGDATSPKTVLLGGLLASTFIVMAIGLAGSLGAHLVVVALMALNGLAQSTVWPNAVAIMAAHFPEASRGSIMGVWSVNGNVGNLLGGMFTGAAQSSGLSIQATLAVPSVFTMGVAFVVWRYLRSTPSASPSNPDERDPIIIKPVMATKGIGVWRALQIPGVVEYSLAYACIKNVNYSAMFWISFWLSSELHFADADASLLSSWYDIGAITGGVLIGFVSDRARLRCLPCVVSMAFASVALAMLTATTPSWGMLAVLLAVNGALINGPSALISSAISADLGSHPTVQQSENAMATVAGVVDGTGALGAAVGQYAIAAFSDSFGWNASFYMLAALCLASCILLRRSLQRDIATVTKRVFGTIEVSRQSSELHKLGDHVH